MYNKLKCYVQHYPVFPLISRVYLAYEKGEQERTLPEF